MHKLKKRAILAIAIFLAVFMVTSAGSAPYFITPVNSVRSFEIVDNMYTASEAVIWTDKPDYLPGEIVTIFGSGFLADSTIEINVTRPDATIDKDVAPTNGTGCFEYYYDLDGIIGQYNVTATDGISVAATFFTDGLHVDFSQYANIADQWTGAILGSSNSLYFEGRSVPQRVAFVDIFATTGNEHCLTFSHMATKGGIHAYDWLTGWNQGNEPPLDFNPWGEEIGPHVTSQICEDLYNSEYYIFVDVPDDSFTSMSYEGSGSYQDRIDAYEAVNGNRQIKISGNAEISSASFTSFSHNPLSDDTGDSDIEYELTWVSASDQILIQMGGHLAVSGNPTGNPVAWGTGLGASVISGGSYHFKLKQLDCYSLGSQDNQIKGEAIVPAEADLGIVKTGPASAEVGDEITYEFEVTNYGPGDALNVIATDNLLGSITLSGLTDEDGDGFADDLAFDAIATGTATHIIPIPGNDPIVDTVLVESSTLDSNTENNQDSHEVDVLRTGVSIQKIGPTSAEVGELITYTITVTNTGEVDLYITSLNDNLLGDLASFISDGVITLLEGSETFDVTYTVMSSDLDPLPNEVTVHVENQFECDPKTDSASWEVDILHPVISLTKTATDGFGFEIFEAYIGDTITYVFKVENTGDVDLTDIILSDITAICDGALIRGPDEFGDNDDILEPGEIWIYTCTHVVTLTDPDPLPNVASVEGTYAPGKTVDDTDDATVDILHYAGTLHVDKTGPAEVNHGETVFYYVYVWYTSSDGSPAQNVLVTDNHYTLTFDAASDDDSDGQLDVGEIWIYYVEVTIADHFDGEEDPIVNIATASGEDLDGDPVGPVSDSVSTNILHYEGTLHIDKYGPETVYHGDTVTYIVEVWYTSPDNSPAQNVIVTDDHYTLVFMSGDLDSDNLLDVGEVWVYQATVTILAHDDLEEDPIVNIADATGQDLDSDALAQVQDSWTTDILHAEGTLTVVKTGPVAAFHNDPVTYTIEVTYSSPDDSPATNVEVLDDHYGPATYVSGDFDGDGCLDVDETWVFQVFGFIVDIHDYEEEDPIINTATATGQDLDGDAVTPVFDTWVTDILHREGTLTVMKTGPETAYHGDSVIFYVDVTYSSDDGSPAQNIVVTDDKYTTVTRVRIGDDDDGDALLELGEVWHYEVSGTIPAMHVEGEEDPIVNTATATGQDLDGDTVNPGSDTWTTDILHREGTLTVVKTGPETAYHGDSMTYYVEVTYSSDDGSPAQNIEVTDDKYAIVTRVDIGLEDDSDLLLEPGEVWYYEVSGTIGAHVEGEEDPIVNTATATGQDLDGDAVTPGSDDHSTDILHTEGTLTVVKTGPETAYHGASVTYEVAVTYTSVDGSPAQNIVVTDDEYATVIRVRVGDNDDGDAFLEFGEIWYYEVSGTIGVHDDDEEDPIVNIVTATGKDLDGDAVTPGSDDHSTDILHTEGTLTVVKTGPEAAYHGDSVTYYVDVTYWSSDGSPAVDIHLTDDHYTAVIFTGGDADGDGYLDVDEIWHYEVSGMIETMHVEGEEDPIVNFATATGQDLDGDEVTPGSDTWTTNILHREGTLTVVKTGPETAYHGDSVTYYVDVTYSSDDGSPAQNIEVTDNKYATVATVTRVDIGLNDDGDALLEPGEVWHYEVSGTIAAMHVDGEEDPIVNTATATGQDLDGDAVTLGFDTWVTDILHYAGTLHIDKYGPVEAYHGDTVTYTVEVWYTSPDNSPAQNVVVIDDHYTLFFMSGDLDSDNLLDVGEVWVYEATVTIGAHDDLEEDPIVNTADVTGQDLDGDAVTPGFDTWTTDILHREGILTVAKIGPATVYHGDMTFYDFIVTYTSLDGSPATNIAIFDDHYGPVIFNGGDTDGDDKLDVTETWFYSVYVFIPLLHSDGEEDPIVNTATVTGEDLDGDPVIQGQDSWTTDILHREGSLAVEKTGPYTAYHGDGVTYMIHVTYSSPDSSPAVGVSVLDDHYGLATYVSGDLDGDNELDVTETWVYTVSGNIAALHGDGEEDPITNTATATGQDLDGDPVIQGQDSWTTDILHREGTLWVEKTGPLTAYHEDLVLCTIYVTYTSSDGSPAKNVAVVDDKYGAALYMSGDTDGDDELDVTETWIFWASGPIPFIHIDGEEDPIINTATATGEDLDGDAVTPGQDSWSIDILHREGQFHLKKTGPLTAYHGDFVTYTIEVNYISYDNSPAKNVIVWDDHYGYATYVSGDIDGDGHLDVGETWFYTVSDFITSLHSDGEEDPIVNTATVSGVDLDGDPICPASDTCTTDILHLEGTLTVVKTGPETAYHGDLVTYTIEVTYWSSDGSPATNVFVFDDQYGSAVYMSGDTDSDFELDVTETWVFQVSDTIPVHDDGEEDPVVNTATATGQDLDGDAVTPGSDTWSTDILHYAGTLHIDKYGPVEVYHGDTVTYIVEVWYTSPDNSPAQNVIVTDDHYTLVFMSGDLDSDNLLDVGEVWVYEATVTILAHDDLEEDPIINTATVSGEDLDGDPVGPASDTCTTDILHREGTLTVLKTGPAEVNHGDMVTYTIYVTYTSPDNSPAQGVVVIDDHYMLVFIDGDDDSDNLLDVGEVWVYEATVTIGAHDDFEEDPIVNTAIATGYDLDGDVVSPGSDDHSTNIFHAYLTVCKIEDFDGDLSTVDDQVPYADGCIIELHRNGLLYDTQMTGPDGCITWLILEPGSYEVVEVVPDGWTPLTPTSYEIEELVDDGVYSYTFANFEWFTVSGYKYEYIEGFADSFDELDFGAWNTMVGDSSWSLTPEGWLYCDPTISFPRILANPTMSYTDYAFEADACLLNGPGYALLFRASGLNDFYSFQYDPGWGLRLRLFQFENFPDGMDVAPSIPYTIDNEWHHLKVIVSSDHIMCYIDGHLVFDVVDTIDPVYLSGGVGFRTWGSEAYFDNVCVLPITAPLDEWTIKLYRDGPLGPVLYDTIVTGDGDWPTGYYMFTVEEPGTYRVVEVLKDGWTAIKPVFHIPSVADEEVEGYSFDAISGLNFECCRFWNFRWADVIVYKYDTDDNLLDGWTIHLRGEEGQPDISDVTTGGQVTFTVKWPGDYYLEEEILSEWTIVDPLSNRYDLTVTSGSSHSFTFVNFKWFDVSGYKWNDLNGDGYWDAEEPRLNGWTIYLFKDSPSTNPADAYATTTSAYDSIHGDGYYKFTITELGSYFIREQIQPQWTKTHPVSQEIGDDTSSIVSTYGYDFNAAGLWSNAGFEKGYLANWNIDSSPDFVGVVGADSYTSPYEGIYMLKLGDGAGTQPMGPNQVSRIFIATQPTLTFVYNIFTYDYEGFNNFHYRLTRISDGYVIAYYSQGAWGWDIDLKSTGWQPVSIDISAYMGQQLKLEIACGGTFDTAYPTWVYVDGSFSFGNFEWFDISGYKWSDLNGDGYWDAEEPRLNGWTIYLFRDSPSTNPADAYATTTTAYDSVHGDGYYVFTIKEGGTYFIREVIQSTWTKTWPLLEEIGHETDDIVCMYGYDFVATSGLDDLEVLSGNNFGNFKWVKLTGYKWHDCDGDTIWDKPDEPGLNGWTIYLYEGDLSDTPEVFITETHDGLDGYYEFTIKRRADYYIREDLPALWTKTYPAPEEVGDDTLDTISTYGYDLENFDNLLAELDIYDFGNFHWVIISGYKFNDLDGDTGWNELEEPGLNGWAIYLYEGDLSDTPEVFITETKGSLDGYFEFTIKRKADYFIREALPTGWTNLYPAPVEIGPGPGGISEYGYDLLDFNNVVAMPDWYRFANFHWFTVTAYKYEDWTGDGYTACEDTPLEGWMFQLDGIEFGPTDELGCAMTIVKLPGHYVVTEILKTGWTQTGIPSYEFDAVSGLDRGPYIFTNFKHFTITGYKYEYFEGFLDKFNELDLLSWLKSIDDDSWSLTPEGWLYCDGSLEWARIFAEPTMSYEDYVFEVDVQLIRDSGWEVFFRSNGLDGDAFASYSLQYEAHCCATLRLLKYVGTTWIELDSIEFPPDYDWHHIKVTAKDGRLRIHIDSVLMFDYTDVEFYPEGGIGLGIMGDARAYFDNVRVLPIINSLEGWTINLYKEGILYATTTTDADGFYCFTDLGPGHYTIAEILQPGWSAILPALHVPEDVGEEVLGHSFDGISGKHIGCKDFWNFKWFYVSGYKWHDVNGDGVGDVGLSGWTMYLFKNNPSTYQEYAYASTTTLAGGYYVFAIKEPGIYFIRELLKMGWTMTFPATQVGSETEDVVSASGYDDIIAVSGMNDILDSNFCNFEWFIVSGHKWNDLNGDGIWQKEEEPPMTCWIVYLFDHNPIIEPEEAIAWTHTGCEDGYYEFLIKEAGLYYIKEEIKPGWTKTAPGDLEIGDETTPIISEEGYEFTVDDLVANPELLTDNDFGNFEWAEVIVYKYDTDDNLLDGWTIHLCGEEGQPDMSDVTVGGQVTFTVKWPGDYYVQEDLKAEWTLISPLTNRHDITVTSGGSLGPYVFVNFEWADIIVYKQDTDGNPLEGWTIELSGPDAQSGVTGADGYVTFTVTQPGSYYIEEILQTEWTLISPLSNRYDIEVHTGGSYSGYVFTNFQWADIIVCKQDTDGTPLDGWSIELFGPHTQSGVTEADGCVTFTVHQPGDYYVQEVLQTGWTLIDPVTNKYNIEVHTGEAYGPYVFMNFEWADIIVCKQDTDGNLLDGWTINLVGPDGQSGITGADGCVTFTVKLPGAYHVEEVLQAEWTLISPLTNRYDIEVHTGGSYSGYVFTNFEWADIIVYKQDTDGNPLEGWTIELFGPDAQSGVTGADGYVTFTVTQPGAYYVQEVLLPEWTLIDPVSNRYDTNVYTGETYGPYVFVNFEWVKISGYKYEDRDGNHESTDYPLGGWTILLYKNSGGDPIEAITGDGDAWPLGYYEFIVKEPGEYAIKEFLQEGWVETSPITAYTPGPQLGYDFESVKSGQDWENRNFWNSGARTYITDTSDCRNIVTEFRLVVTPDFSEGEVLYKIASTNPGGFYFNIIFHAWTDGEIEINYDLGYGFIEHGGQPIHAYVWTDLDSDGVVDWCDGEVTCIDKTKIVSVDYENGIIVFDGLEECNDILVTIHMKFDKKNFQNLEKDWIEDNLLGKDYEFSASVEGCWSSTTILTETSDEVKKLKACAVFGVVLEEAEHDEPVSGAIFRLYKDGDLLKARTTGEDGIFYFDKLDDGTYYLDIELPLGLILQDSEYDDTVIYLRIQIKLQDGDFISIGVFIKTGGSEPDSDPPDVSTTMEQIWIPSASSDQTDTSDPPNRADRDGSDDIGNIPAIVASNPIVGIAIAVAWFGSVVSLAFVYNTRTRQRKIQAAISRPTRYSLQWSLEDLGSEW